MSQDNPQRNSQVNPQGNTENKPKDGLKTGGAPVATSLITKRPDVRKHYGINSILSNQGHIYHDSLFSTRHFGRVSDLIVALLKNKGADELRLRAALLFAEFEAFRTVAQIQGVIAQNEADNANTEVPSQSKSLILVEPLHLEIGFDSEWIAISVSVPLIPEILDDPAGLQTRLDTFQPHNEFEVLLKTVEVYSDLVFLKVFKHDNRAEIVSLLGRTQIDNRIFESGKFEIILIDQIEPATVSAMKYEALSDVDYASLLRDEGPAGVELPPGIDGSIIIAATAPWLSDNETIGGSPSDMAEEILRMSPSGEEAAARQSFNKKANQNKEDVMRFSSSPSAEDDDTTRFTSGSHLDGDGIDESMMDSYRPNDTGVQRFKSSQNGDLVDQINQVFKGSSTVNGDSSALDANEDIVFKAENATTKNELSNLTFSANEHEERLDLLLNEAKSNLDEALSQELISIPDTETTVNEERLMKQNQMYRDQMEILQKRYSDLKDEMSSYRYKVKQIGDIAESQIEAPSLDYGNGRKKKRYDSMSDPESSDEFESRPKPKKGILGAIKKLFTSDTAETIADEDSENALLYSSKSKKTRSTEDATALDSGNSDDFNTDIATDEAKGGIAIQHTAGATPEDSERKKALEVALMEKESLFGKLKDLFKGGFSQGKSAKEVNQEVAKLLGEMGVSDGGGIEEAIRKATEEAGQIKDEVTAKRTKRLMENMMDEARKEKGRLNEMAKKIQLSMKQKDAEFRRELGIAQDEARSKEEALTQKIRQLAQTKDQMTELQSKLQTLKESGQKDANNEYKTKFQHMQKNYDSVKEENFALKRKLDEAKKSAVKKDDSKTLKGPTASEFAEVKNRFEKSIRQIEEQKKQLANLQNKLEDAKHKAETAPNPDAELNKKLETAKKQVNDQKREIQDLKIKQDEMAKESMRLKLEISKMKAIRAATQSQNKEEDGPNKGKGPGQNSANAANAASAKDVAKKKAA